MRVSLLLSLLVLASCATSPTGRSQLLMMSAQDMDQMGATAFTDMKKNVPIEKAAGTNQYVNCVADAVTAALAPKDQRDWEVVVFNDDSANAFALPGGKIGVHTGLLKVATNQSQLATVIGHEIGHVLAQHGNERMSIQSTSQAAQQLAGALLGGSQEGALAVAALGLGAQYGVTLPFSRSHESEADFMGLEIMAKAGFDPTASVVLWQNMAKNSSGAPQEFMSTHPSNETRIRDLRSAMSPANELYRSAKARGIQPNCKP